MSIDMNLATRERGFSRFGEESRASRDSRRGGGKEGSDVRIGVDRNNRLRKTLLFVHRKRVDDFVFARRLSGRFFTRYCSGSSIYGGNPSRGPL